MMHLVPYEPQHLLGLDLQPAQAHLSARIDAANARDLAGPHAVTLVEDGVPLACGGVAPYWAGRAYAWVFIGSGVTGGKFVAASRLARRWLDNLPFVRVEAAADCRYPRHAEWLRLLGFRQETAPNTPMQEFLDGVAHHLFARVRKG